MNVNSLNGHGWRYDTIKALAKAEGVKVTDLIALAQQNDPFYAGTDGDKALGAWFADLWERFGYTTGVHLRRVHYEVVSQQTPVKLPNGLAYENTEGCWKTLSLASKVARYLKYVDPAAFVDRRNPEPILLQPAANDLSLEVYANRWGAYLSLPDFPDLPTYNLEGYGAAGRQRYHMEVWCEKSTMDDVLIPLCRQYGANLVRGVGELSVTACLDLVRRRLQPGRPLRIFYVSDFDPAGQSMPVAVARKVEYFIRNDTGLDGADVRLSPVVLTADQVKHYRLPRTPIKDTELRAAHFEDRYGEGAVELDALEALYPGELRRILEHELRRYYDTTLAARVSDARNKLQNDLGDIRQGIIDPRRDELAQLRREYDAIQQEFRQRIAGVSARLGDLWSAIAAEMEDAAPSLEDYPIPEADTAIEGNEALYDSGREYIDQIHAYKVFQGKRAVTLGGEE